LLDYVQFILQTNAAVNGQYKQADKKQKYINHTNDYIFNQIKLNQIKFINGNG